MTLLDDRETYGRLDPTGMDRHIQEFPRTCRDAWREAATVSLPDDYRDVERVVVAGMGGSAIAGDLVRGLAELESPVPIQVQRDYRLPAYVDPRTLVIASSYSGNTEETLSAVEDALERKAPVLALTSGGRLADLAAHHHLPLFRIRYQAPPRATLGYSLVPLVALLERLGILADKEGDLNEAVQVMEEMLSGLGPAIPTAANPAKQLAHRLHGRLPVIYGAGFLADVARRWKTQINENSKQWAVFEVLPELHHNAVVGYPNPADLRDRLYVVLLRSSLLHPRTLARYPITTTLLANNAISYEVLDAQGRSPLAHMLSTLLFGDLVSYYLALLNEADPYPVAVIDFLKDQLARV
ncbi:MAG: bifunctional phosphoglucose/phosphomannose isomerase [Chloroflexi bacterium]|nr:bifunctional phosphoglucose/phosphomannose isomerase [Chloroflexota bacterium]